MTDQRSVTLTMPAVQAPAAYPTSPAPTASTIRPPPGARRPAVPRRVAFWLLAFVLTATMLGTTLPTPLYVIYQAQWHFSAAIVTVTFAVYAAGVLLTLLLAGGPRTRPGANRCWPRPSAQRAEHGRVHPGPRRGGADRRPDPVRALGGPDDRHGDGHAHRADPGLGQPPGLAGGHGREHGRPRPRPAHRRALRPVRAPPHGPGVRGVPGGAGGRGPVLVPGPGNGEPTRTAHLPLRRPRHPRTGPGRVRRRRRWPGSPPSPCSGCSPGWRPPSSGACCTSATTPSRVASCSCCWRWGPRPSWCWPGSAAAGS